MIRILLLSTTVFGTAKEVENKPHNVHIENAGIQFDGDFAALDSSGTWDLADAAGELTPDEQEEAKENLQGGIIDMFGMDAGHTAIAAIDELAKAQKKKILDEIDKYKSDKNAFFVKAGKEITKCVLDATMDEVMGEMSETINKFAQGLRRRRRLKTFEVGKKDPQYQSTFGFHFKLCFNIGPIGKCITYGRIRANCNCNDWTKLDKDIKKLSGKWYKEKEDVNEVAEKVEDYNDQPEMNDAAWAVCVHKNYLKGVQKKGATPWFKPYAGKCILPNAKGQCPKEHHICDNGERWIKMISYDKSGGMEDILTAGAKVDFFFNPWIRNKECMFGPTKSITGKLSFTLGPLKVTLGAGARKNIDKSGKAKGSICATSVSLGAEVGASASALAGPIPIPALERQKQFFRPMALVPDYEAIKASVKKKEPFGMTGPKLEKFRKKAGEAAGALVCSIFESASDGDLDDYDFPEAESVEAAETFFFNLPYKCVDWESLPDGLQLLALGPAIYKKFVDKNAAKCPPSPDNGWVRSLSQEQSDGWWFTYDPKTKGDAPRLDLRPRSQFQNQKAAANELEVAAEKSKQVKEYWAYLLIPVFVMVIVFSYKKFRKPEDSMYRYIEDNESEL